MVTPQRVPEAPQGRILACWRSSCDVYFFWCCCDAIRWNQHPQKRDSGVRKDMDNTWSYIPHRCEHRDWVFMVGVQLHFVVGLLSCVYAMPQRRWWWLQRVERCICVPKNANANSGQIDVEAALMLFRCSLEKNDLHYKNIVCDGDRRIFLALCDSKIFSFIALTKDYVNHVKKKCANSSDEKVFVQ